MSAVSLAPMGRIEITHRLPLEPAWVTLIASAWKRLKAHGAKKKVYEAAGLTRSTAHRVVTGTQPISYDAIENLRLAINKELNEDAVPPAVAGVRSASHLKAIGAAAAMDAAKRLDGLAPWVDLGRRLVNVGKLDDAVKAITSLMTPQQVSESIGGDAATAAQLDLAMKADDSRDESSDGAAGDQIPDVPSSPDERDDDRRRSRGGGAVPKPSRGKSDRG